MLARPNDFLIVDAQEIIIEVDKIITQKICKDVAKCILDYAMFQEFSFWQSSFNCHFGVPVEWKQGLQQYIGCRIVSCTDNNDEIKSKNKKTKCTTIVFETLDKTKFAHNFKFCVEPVFSPGWRQTRCNPNNAKNWLAGYYIRGITVCTSLHRAMFINFGLHNHNDCLNFGFVISKTIDGSIYPRQLWIHSNYTFKYIQPPTDNCQGNDNDDVMITTTDVNANAGVQLKTDRPKRRCAHIYFTNGNKKEKKEIDDLVKLDDLYMFNLSAVCDIHDSLDNVSDAAINDDDDDDDYKVEENEIIIKDLANNCSTSIASVGNTIINNSNCHHIDVEKSQVFLQNE